LEGAIGQTGDKIEHAGRFIAQQHFHSLTFCNDEMGSQSIAKLARLLPQLTDLRLMFLRVPQPSVTDLLMETLHERANVLLTLRLSQVPHLVEPRIFRSFVQMVKSRSYL
jgi:hypothetical protein